MSMSRSTGHTINSTQHLSQSIADILTTPIGSRVMRREYGALVTDLIDQPKNGTTIVRLYAAAAAALHRWEPRIRVTQVLFEPGTEHGAGTLTVNGTVRRTGQAFSSSVPLRMGASA